MKLSDKGRLAPPPRLHGAAQMVVETVRNWSGVIAATHWHLEDRRRVDGADFYLDDETKELGHIHLDGEVHLALTEALAAELVDRRLAAPFEWDRAWVAYRIRGPKTAAHAVELFRIAYERLRGRNGLSLPSLLATRGG